MAITACEAFGTMTPPVRILATDIDTQVLATARRGVYPLERISGLDEDTRRRYFQRGTGPNEGRCRVHPALLSALAANLVIPNHVLSRGRHAVRLTDLSHDELKEIADKAMVNGAAGADLQLLLSITGLWGDEARRGLRFSEVEAPPTASRFGALLGFHR